MNTPSPRGRVHCPQLCEKNRAIFLATATMSVSSSKIVGHAVPSPSAVVLADVEIHRRVELVGAEDARRHAAGDRAANFLPFRMPPL